MTILNSPGERLKHLRSLVRLNRTQISDKYGLNPNTLKSWENNVYALTEKAIKKCIEIYEDEGIIFSHEWLLSGKGLAPKTFAEIGKNFNMPKDSLTIDENENELFLLKEVKFFKDLYSDGTVMIVPNNDMLPFYKVGDYVCGRWLFLDKISQAVGQDCIIQLINGSKYFRRLVQDNNAFYNITCLNPLEVRYEPVLYNVQIECVAPIIWHRRIAI